MFVEFVKNDFYEQLMEREIILSREIDKRNKRMGAAPDGELRIITNGRNVQYYRRNVGETNGNYLKKSEVKLITALAQKRYDSKFIKVANSELKCIRRFLKQYKNEVDKLGLDYPWEIKGQMDLAAMTDEEYAYFWQNQKYTPKKMKDDVVYHVTSRGERVRSKSEELIANILLVKGIPYKYECPVRIYNGELRYPDFTILNTKTRKVVYLEHLGKMDDPDYVTSNYLRLKDYERSGIYIGHNLLVTMEDRMNPLNTKAVEDFIRIHFGK